MLELSNCTIVSPQALRGAERKAVAVLIEEIERRTGIQLQEAHQPPESGAPFIAVASEASLDGTLAPTFSQVHRLERPGSEGYRILVESLAAPAVWVLGADARGLLFGIGKLLRQLVLREGSIQAKRLALSSTPKFPVRGHQLGYRPKTNAYDAWTESIYDQYIRELALFGANSIEILPPRTDDRATGPHLKVPPLEMMEKLSGIIDSYGLDVWVWYPNLGEDYSNPKTIEAELAEREEIFSRLPRVDKVFIPGGDPGELAAGTLFAWIPRIYEVLRKHHPNAKIWLSPQKFDPPPKWLDAFYRNIQKEPEWLGGVVFGPWVKTTLPQVRKLVPKRYPIRHYPDIAHTWVSQFPIPNWDPAFAMTLGREPINPLPNMQKHIHNTHMMYCDGSLSYSEGINDDVNKFIWSDQDWDPTIEPVETLRDYARLFIDPDQADAIAQGIRSLEANFHGPLLVNEGVDTTLQQWLQIEARVAPAKRDNYRLQMCLLRAHFDAYIRRRLLHETEIERSAVGLLEQAANLGSQQAMAAAEAAFERAHSEPVATSYKERCLELADRLFENIGAQLTVEKHKASSWDRGAFVDAIDIPLNNVRWYLSQFDRVRTVEDEAQRLVAIDALVNRTNPGPGGFYDNFGTQGALARLDPGHGWEKDPGYKASPMISFASVLLYDDALKHAQMDPVPLAWISHATTLFNNPLTIRYDNLDPNGEYVVRATYIGIGYLTSYFGSIPVRLLANGDALVHDYVETNGECRTREFALPKGAIGTDGRLALTWSTPENAQGPSIAEVWLLKRSE